jgi:hypothetical protein
MAQAVLETLLYREYLKRRMPPEEAAAKAQEAAAAYKAQTGLSEEEIVAGMRQQREAEDWKSFANQVLTKSPVLSETPRRASTQRVLGASALTNSVNPAIREIGEQALQNRLPDPAIRAALEKTVTDQAKAQQTAHINEQLRRGVSPGVIQYSNGIVDYNNPTPQALAYMEHMRRPYDTSAIISDQDRVDEAVAAAKRRAEAAQEVSRETARGNTMGNLRSNRLANEANLAAYGAGQQASYPSSSATGESIQRALEMANAKANNMEFEGSLLRNYNAPQNYDVDTQSFRGLPSAVPPPSSTVDRSGEDVDDLRLAQDITGSTAGGALVKGAMPSPGGAAPSSTNIAGSLPLMARAGADDNIMGFRGGAYTPGASADRTMRLNMPGLFPAQAPATGTTSAAAPAARPPQPMPLARPSSVPRGESASFLSRLFGGGDERQSTGARVQDMNRQGRTVVDWGNPESSADFFRADKAAREWNAKNAENQAIGAGSSADTGMKRGGSVGGGKDAALHKALEIIHHLLTRGR